MPECQYFIRGELVTVDEIPGVLAVKLELPSDEALAARERRAAIEALNGEIPVEMSDTERRAFSKAGWVLVRRPTGGADEIRRMVRASHVGRVFRHRGRTLIGTDSLAVKLRPEISSTQVRAILEEMNLEVVRQLRFAENLYEVRVGPGRDFLSVAVQLHHRSEVEYAEPEMIQHVGQRWAPRDPRYLFQWQWHKLGRAGADIGAEIAWDVTRGAGTRIAVIDNGFDVTHEDLVDAIGPGSGYFQPVGSDAVFVVGLAGFPPDPLGHGTFCAGMAAARADNGTGGCGMANEAELMLIACLQDQLGTQITLARAIAYATDPTTEADDASSEDGAWAISCSLGPSDGNWQLESVLDNALNFAVLQGRGGKGTLIFWAVGNDDLPVDNDPVCAHPATIAVGRSTRWDQRGGSAYGCKLDFLAPGVGVYSTLPGHGYGYDTGSSFAAPCAAGIAALVLAVREDLTWAETRQIMWDTCDKIGPVTYGPDGRHDLYGYGRVSAGQAVLLASGAS